METSKGKTDTVSFHAGWGNHPVIGCLGCALGGSVLLALVLGGLTALGLLWRLFTYAWGL